MEKLKIESTEDSPQIILERESNIMEISGRSLPEDVNTFYEPMMSWIEEYAKDPLDVTVFSFKLTYFNTASSKIILDILTHFEEMIEEGHKVMVRWHYLEEDEDMLEAGEEYSEMVDVPFEMVSYS
ncbi:MAG: DUF1987 domain-containing protein [Bacteroidales bacterium]|nr:DUF1987 domain-containing protein [Bacteroidales bacterium]